MLWIIAALVILCAVVFFLLRNRGKAGGKSAFARPAPRDWSKVMTMPADSRIAAANASGAFPPMIVFSTDYGVGRCSAYQAIFRTDHTSVTHWSPMFMQFEIDRPFRERHPNLNAGGICAFQIHSDGSHIIKLALWYGFAKNDREISEPVSILKETAGQTAPGPGIAQAGKAVEGIPMPKVIFPVEITPRVDENGSCAEYYMPYDWKVGTAYNVRTDLTRPSGGGHMVLNLWIREGTKGGWTRLISIDTGMKESVMFGNLGYMCRIQNSAEVRTMELSDMWARSLENGTWHAAKAVTPYTEGEWKGSYHFGADGSAAWAITSGVEGLCPKPESRRFELTQGNPPA